MTIIALLWFALGCAGGNGVLPTDSGTADDFECPNIESIPVTSPQVIGNDVLVTANITDDPSGVLSAVLYYKLETSVSWKDETMENTAGSSYAATIPGTDVNSAAGMHYYIWAQDGSPQLNACTLPNDGEDGPFHFTLDDAAKGG